MSRPRSSPSVPSIALTPRVKVWLQCDGHDVCCRGITDILQAVEHSGSIKQAAHDLGKSYRHVWSRIKEAEAALGQTLVEAHVGGTGSQRSFLTDTARQLIRDFLALRARMREVLAEEFERCFPPPADVPERHGESHS
jgi:molybdate transport repressor ModE-like protein